MDTDDFAEFVKAKASENFRTHGHLAPVIVAVQPQGITGELLPMDDKEEAARLIQRIRATSPLVATVVEAWYVDMTKMSPEQVRSAMTMPPSKHPKRIEVAMVTVYQGLRKAACVADIIRRGRKKPVLGPWKAVPMAEAEGRFVEPPTEWN